MEITFDIPSAFQSVLKPDMYLRQWLAAVARSEGKILERLHYRFMTDEELLAFNIDFLQHDTYTDVITFDYCQQDYIIGEAYISWERLVDNAKNMQVEALNETYRVLAHALLHLCGYGDKSPEEQKIMRAKEDYSLSLLPEILTRKQ